MRLFGLLLTSALVATAGSAMAQSNPSAASIIDQLRPRPGMTGGTRGLRPLNPADNAAPPAAAPAAPSAASQAGLAPPVSRPVPARPAASAPPSVNLTVQFATNSAELTPAAMHTLDELGRALSSDALASSRFRIEGHTDTVGTPDRNMALSDERAKAVVDYLVSKFNVPRDRLQPVGMGETHLLVPTSNGVAEPRNRRVTVVNVSA